MAWIRTSDNSLLYGKSTLTTELHTDCLVGPEGFEPTCGIPDLQSGAIDRSATSPLFGASPRTRTEKLLNLNQEGRPIPFNDAYVLLSLSFLLDYHGH